MRELLLTDSEITLSYRHPMKLFITLLSALFAFSGITQAQRTLGRVLYEPEAQLGYTMYAPLVSDDLYLVDLCGDRVHEWNTTSSNAGCGYLLEDGNMIRVTRGIPNSVFTAGGSAGRAELYDWEGNLLWTYDYSSTEHLQHHDIEYLPNGNVLMIAWKLKNNAECVAAGRNPSLLFEGQIWPEHIIEVEPVGTTGGNIVWEWHTWDHLIQDFDSTKDNYGDVAAHPELMDINFTDVPGRADWLHANSIEYIEKWDQIVLSLRHINEVWVIDHSTTTAEAATHSGGNSGKGGDLLYRWGNPAAYRAGTSEDQRLFGQHDASFISDDLPYPNSLMVYNNGRNRPQGDYSTIDRWSLPVDSLGNYTIVPGMAFEPANADWTFTHPDTFSFIAPNISGVQMQPNGDVLICQGPSGIFFEVAPDTQIVWKYVSPVTSIGILNQGDPVPGGGIGFTNVFRAYRYPPDFPGLVGKDLTPTTPVELLPWNDSCMIAEPPVGISDAYFPEFRIAPNPSSGNFVVSGKGLAGKEIEIWNLQGKRVLRERFQGNETHVDLTHTPRGIYLLKIENSVQRLLNF